MSTLSAVFFEESLSWQKLMIEFFVLIGFKTNCDAKNGHRFAKTGSGQTKGKHEWRVKLPIGKIQRGV
jgi:hypothetical protein